MLCRNSGKLTAEIQIRFPDWFRFEDMVRTCDQLCAVRMQSEAPSRPELSSARRFCAVLEPKVSLAARKLLI